MTHDHTRPDTAAMLAGLAVARAILDGADHGTAHAAAGSCPACAAVAGISHQITTTSTLLGDKTFVSERTRLVLLAAIDASEAELRAAGN
jgi:hypothetical protein